MGELDDLSITITDPSGKDGYSPHRIMDKSEASSWSDPLMAAFPINIVERTSVDVRLALSTEGSSYLFVTSPKMKTIEDSEKLPVLEVHTEPSVDFNTSPIEESACRHEQSSSEGAAEDDLPSCIDPKEKLVESAVCESDDSEREGTTLCLDPITPHAVSSEVSVSTEELENLDVLPIPIDPSARFTTSSSIESTRRHGQSSSRDAAENPVLSSIDSQKEPVASSDCGSDGPDKEGAAPHLIMTTLESVDGEEPAEAGPLPQDLPCPAQESKGSDLENVQAVNSSSRSKSKKTKNRGGQAARDKKARKAAWIVQHRAEDVAQTLRTAVQSSSPYYLEVDAIEDNERLSAYRVAGVALCQSLEQFGWPAEVQGKDVPREPELLMSLSLPDVSVMSPLSSRSLRYQKLSDAAHVVEALGKGVRQILKKTQYSVTSLFMEPDQLGAIVLSRMCEHLLQRSAEDQEGFLDQIKELREDFLGLPTGELLGGSRELILRCDLPIFLSAPKHNEVPNHMKTSIQTGSLQDQPFKDYVESALNTNWMDDFVSTLSTLGTVTDADVHQVQAIEQTQNLDASASSLGNSAIVSEQVVTVEGPQPAAQTTGILRFAASTASEASGSRTVFSTSPSASISKTTALQSAAASSSSKASVTVLTHQGRKSTESNAETGGTSNEPSPRRKKGKRSGVEERIRNSGVGRAIFFVQQQAKKAIGILKVTADDDVAAWSMIIVHAIEQSENLTVNHLARSALCEAMETFPRKSASIPKHRQGRAPARPSNAIQKSPPNTVEGKLNDAAELLTTLADKVEEALHNDGLKTTLSNPGSLAKMVLCKICEYLQQKSCADDGDESEMLAAILNMTAEPVYWLDSKSHHLAPMGGYC